MTIEVIKPSLSLVDAELVIKALDAYSLASHDLDEMDRCRDVRTRVASAAHRKGWRLETDA
jgi:hypothetical protein